MTNIAMVKPWPIEIDDFPSSKPPFMVGIFHGYVSHNHMVYSVADGSYLRGITPGLPSQGQVRYPGRQDARVQDRSVKTPATLLFISSHEIAGTVTR